MYKLYVFVLVLSVILLTLFVTQPIYAISQNVVISQIKVGNSSVSRLVEIYNNSNTSVDINGWCLKYSSPSNTSPYTNLGCFVNSDSSVHMFIGAGSYALLASTQTGLSADIILSEGLGSGTSGHVYLTDNQGIEVDRVGWGTAVNAETKPVVLDSTKVIERKRDVGLNKLIDTDNNESDFVVSTLRTTYQYGAIYEVVDVCGNIDGLQEIMPDGMESNGSGGCVAHDECSNLPDIQTIIPDGYKRGDENICMLDLMPLKISELMPNAIGTDGGNEFIEIFNPNNTAIDLTNYVLYVGANNTKYNFPVGSHIDAGKYLTFSNDEIKFTLLNTTGNVMLRSVDDTLIDETPVYDNPGDGMAWALIDNVWQYTDQPTPGSPNVSSSVEIDSDVVLTSNLAPCADNQYRSPETNRCRLIVTSTSILAPCKDGQYRSEETNRCRSIASDSAALTPCDEGQERNPATNRCRSTTAVLAASSLVPCKEGQERNPETNRCRNIASAMPLAEYKPEQTNQSVNNYIIWWSLAAVLLVAIIYGIWEWRHEVVGLFRKIKIKVFRGG
jgi:hypothetical protein